MTRGAKPMPWDGLFDHLNPPKKALKQRWRYRVIAKVLPPNTEKKI